MASVYHAASGALRLVYDRHLGTPPRLDADRYFPGHADFEREFPAIRAECVALMAEMGAIPEFHELMQEQAELSRYGGRFWRMFILRAYGAGHRANLARCPALSRLLRAHPEVTSATFSILEGGKHIPAHRGPFRGVLRYHLPLVIPRGIDGRPSNRLRVDGQTYALEEGRGILWDDTYEHEAWNDAPAVRAVLLLDVFRPEQPLGLRWLTRAVISGVGLAWLLTGRGRR
ncbi:MAG TPA: aspartyl/asparaginyl beta-hydroxylase domain-containing protein [Gammaproteobacteria bacterium]|jgi:aspartate beta-hydroxylase